MAPLVIGTTFLRYRLEAVLGTGGTGTVYLARDIRVSRPVVLKAIASDRLDRAFRNRLRAEALALSSFTHPNVVNVYDFGCDGGIDYLVMEYVPGATVEELLQQGPFDSERTAALGAQLARGLAAAHAAEVIHRDIKPASLRVTPAGALKILDFGTAVSPAARLVSKTTGTAIETPRPAAGTLRYMAPERLRGDMADARTDMFSAGLVLHEMACGRPPYEGDQPIRLMEAILYGRPPRPRDVNPQIDPALELVIMRAVSPDSARRYESAEALAIALERLPPRRPRLRRPAVKALTRWVGRLAGALV
jgi:eukaryotic-like serine/threonine-protein kinase